MTTKRKILSYLLTLAMALSLFTALGVTAYAEDLPDNANHEGCNHAGVGHFYLTGTYYDDLEEEDAAVGRRFNVGGGHDDFEEGAQPTIYMDNFPEGATAGWYYLDNDNKYQSCSSTSKLSLTVNGTTVAGKTYDGTTTATATLGTVSGIAEDDDVTVSIESATFEDKNAGTGKSVTVTYTVSGDDADKYTAPANDTLTADIDKREVTLTSASASKEYDGTALTAYDYDETGDGFVDGEGFACMFSGTQTEVGSSANTFTYILVKKTLADNYDITTVYGTLTVWGTCGGCNWVIDGDGKLTIKPAETPAEGYIAGQLPDGAKHSNFWPWYTEELRNTIKSVVVEDGVKAGNSLDYMFGTPGDTIEIPNLTEVDLSGLEISSNVESMTSLFFGCKSLKSITWPESMDTSGVTRASSMFGLCSELSAATRIEYVNEVLENNNGVCTTWTTAFFKGCTDETIDLSALDTSNVTNMNLMFAGYTNLKSLDLSGFDTSKVKSMYAMFSGCTNLKSIYVGSGWSTAAVENSLYMFNNCTSLVGGAGTTYDSEKTDAAYAHIDSAANPGYLTEAVVRLDDGSVYGSVQAAISAAGETEHTIMMLADSTENVVVSKGQDIVLDLNGHVLCGKGVEIAAVQGAYTVQGYVASSSVITNEGYLIIQDSDPNAAHTGDYAKYTGGLITGGSAELGGGILNDEGTLCMSGGTIAGNSASHRGGGLLNNGDAILENVKILDNTAATGAGVHNADWCTIQMANCTISGNKAANDQGEGVEGGGILNCQNAEIVLLNCTVTDNSSDDVAGGIANYGSALMLCGSTVIKDNTANGAASNVYLAEGTTAELNSQYPLTTGASIGITTETVPTKEAPVQIISNGSAADAAYFFGDSDSYAVSYNADGYLQLGGYSITTSTPTNGSYTVKVGSDTVTKAIKGAVVTVEPTADTGYEVDTVSVKDSDGNDVAVSNNRFTMPAADVTVTVTFKAVNYTITKANTRNGRFTVSAETATVDTTITITTCPARGYEVDTVSVKDSGGNDVPVTDNQFTMPAKNVTVTVTFKAVTPTPSHRGGGMSCLWQWVRSLWTSVWHSGRWFRW